MVSSPPRHNENNDDLEKSFGNGSQEQIATTTMTTNKPSMTKCQKFLVIALVIVVFCATICTLKYCEHKATMARRSDMIHPCESRKMEYYENDSAAASHIPYQFSSNSSNRFMD